MDRYSWDQRRRLAAGFHIKQGWRNIHEFETLVYSLQQGALTTPSALATIDANIRAIKSGGTVTLTNQTLNMSLGGWYGITNALTDLRPYALIAGASFSVTKTGTPGTAAVFSGTLTPGTGETLGDELFVEPGFDASGSWVEFLGTGAWSISGGKAIFSYGSAVALSQVKNYSSGTLLKQGIVCSDYISGTIKNIMQSTTTGDGITGTGTVYGYRTSTGTVGYYGIFPQNAGGSSFSDATLKQVLTPSATGFTASALTNAGIDPNAATYSIAISKP